MRHERYTSGYDPRKRLRVVLFAAVGLGLLALGTGCLLSPWTIHTDHLGPATEIGQRTVTADSPEAAAVREWLRAHPNGWRWSLDTYAPADYLRGDDFTLNVTGRLCVLNYREPGQDVFTQVVRPLADGEESPDVFGEK